MVAAKCGYCDVGISPESAVLRERGDEGEGLGLGVEERKGGGRLGDSVFTSAILDSCSYVVPSLYTQ